MTHKEYEFESSCGKGRRGCCIIKPDDDSDHIVLLDIVYGLPNGQPSIRSMVFVQTPKVAGESSETIG